LKIGLDASVLIASIKRAGEKHHAQSLRLAQRIVARGHEGICSALVLTEVPGALASSTTMPVDKIYETEMSLIAGFKLSVRPFEQYADRAVDLMLEFRELKRRFGIGSADFHHLATAAGEGCELFVTVDERHLLRDECRQAFSNYVSVCTPLDALKKA
jgi:predicted nucleic acid-binding protein